MKDSTRFERACWILVVLVMACGALHGCAGLFSSPQTDASDIEIQQMRARADAAEKSGAPMEDVLKLRADAAAKEAANAEAKAKAAQSKIHETSTALEPALVGLGAIGGGVALVVRFADTLAQTPLVGSLFKALAGPSRSAAAVAATEKRLDVAGVPPLPTVAVASTASASTNPVTP